jgi:hypothetical protein
MAEPRGRARQAIDIGGLDQSVAVAPQVVGPDCVNRDDNDIGFCFRCLESDRKADETQERAQPPRKSRRDEKAFSPIRKPGGRGTVWDGNTREAFHKKDLDPCRYTIYQHIPSSNWTAEFVPKVWLIV